MRIAVIADVHANLAALEAVSRVLTGVAPDRVLCLGDTVGYNAEPEACIDLVQARCDVILAGNHDVDVTINRPSGGTHEVARLVQAWTRDRLDAGRLDWLRTLRPKYVEPGVLLAHHGSFMGSDPTLGYVTSTMLEENLRAIADAGEAPLAFCGHSHVPLMGWLTAAAVEEVQPRGEETVHWPSSAKAVLINPGAVGQPRDRDPRASFAVVDTRQRSVTWHRVAYDIEETVLQIQRAGLPPILGERLREGR